MSMEFVKYLVRPGFSIWGKNHSQVIPYSSTEKPEFQCLKISFTEKKITFSTYDLRNSSP